MTIKLKPFLFLTVFFLTFTNVNGQMTPCTPTVLNPNPCGSSCMDITIINNTTCDLSLYWGYAGCTYVSGFSLPISPGNQETKTGPCAKCPGDNSPCECPNRIMLVDASGVNFWPWGDFTTMLANGNSQYLNQPNICSCGPVNITINITGPNSATIIISC